MCTIPDPKPLPPPVPAVAERCRSGGVKAAVVPEDPARLRLVSGTATVTPAEVEDEAPGHHLELTGVKKVEVSRR